MKSYKVTITETLEKIVEVKAPSREDAELLVERNWKNSEYILDADNFTGVTFQAERASATGDMTADGFHRPANIRPVPSKTRGVYRVSIILASTEKG